MLRFIGWVILAGVFLLATFAGNLTHSIVADWLRFAPRGTLAWLLGAGILIVAIWAWRRRQLSSKSTKELPGA